MVSRSGEVVDALHRRKIDFCCAQETRWKGESVMMFGANRRRYKFFGNAVIRELLVLVCLLLRDGLTVLSMWSVNDRMMYVKLVIGKQIVNIVSAYAPQVGLSAEEKDGFWDSLIIVLS